MANSVVKDPNTTISENTEPESAWGARTPGGYASPGAGFIAPSDDASSSEWGACSNCGGYHNPRPYSLANDATYTRVPDTPFPFSELPLIPRIMVLEWYLEICGTEGSLSNCDCMKVSDIPHSWETKTITQDDLCYNLHQMFGYHAKFLPLLLTSWQMHDEFRPRRYAWGNFTIIPTNSIRESRYRNWSTRSRAYDRETKLDAWPTISHITPYPENALNRKKASIKAPLLSFKKIDIGIWSEIREITLKLEFYYYEDWNRVRRELQFLARMLGKRVFPLRKLSVTMHWSAGGETGLRTIKKKPETTRIQVSAEQNWEEIVAPLKTMKWGKNVARAIHFSLSETDRYNVNTWARETWVVECRTVDEFIGGMKAGVEDGRVDVIEQ
ncbi:hypothetical protein BCR34DRAFT_584222 [Clohesyomyces aquaticus]|uniref:Uncharacterized protein n=1 Tax=Clohesyomyces aquaticus TaxID=1231657 RepID=A0A1Y2A1Z9_9PLEO|nr:hypothetical protein BCR34DRAFT_584222 [Clohesyomyces aquaticus]